MKAFDLEKVMEVIAAFNSKKNYFELLNVILDKMMEMTNSDAGTLYILEGGKLHFRIIRTISMNIFKGGGDDIDLPPICLEEGNIRNVSAYSALKNEIVCIDDVYSDKRFNFAGPKNYDNATGYRTRSMLVFPLASMTEEAAEVIGVIQLINSIDPETGEIRSFRDMYEPSILLAMSNISANALANILYIKHLAETLTERERVRSELEIASRIQSSVLPCVFPAFPERVEFDIHALMQPAKEVGGDLYDFFMMDSENLAIVVGDVSGKGVPAALFMMEARTLIKNEAKYCDKTEEIFYNVNKQLCEGNESSLFVTAFIAFYNFRTGVMRFTNAGHCYPIIMRRGGERFYLEGGRSLVLAVMDDTVYKSAEVSLYEGDALLLYTDGVTEAFNACDEQFSDERLFELADSIDIGAFSAKAVVDRICGAIDAFAEGAEQSDDITLLALKRLR